jgi:hypothetical protein
MGIEKLNSAARAAGFAMANTDELSIESAAVVSDFKSSQPDVVQPVVTRPMPSTGDWLRSMFGSIGRRAPA